MRLDHSDCSGKKYDGNRCADHILAREARHRIQQPERVREQDRRWRAKHPEVARAASLRWQMKHPALRRQAARFRVELPDRAPEYLVDHVVAILRAFWLGSDA